MVCEKCWCGAESLIWGRLKSYLVDSWFNSRMGDTKSVQNIIFMFLMLIKGMRRVEFKIFLRDPRDGKIFFRSSASC